ncbi:substrate-binding domain-containing protein [Christensenella intestinihominis]|uniref:substrate-binding domain-containing protein n=1 Tax=Christensenella intestinihominis TaxID=1851429 RepID=UPI00082D48CE|nr:substrate-binding domain-containing protein [Christensenella intestinihominis]
MDRRKRFLTMLVCFVLAAFMLTACAGAGAPAATESAAAGQGTETETPAATDTAEAGTESSPAILTSADVGDVSGIEGWDGPVESQVMTAGEDGDQFGTAESTVVVGKGPKGEVSTPWTEIALTDEEKEQIRSGNYKAAICFHYTTDDWYVMQRKGIEETLTDLGVEVVAVTDAGFSAEQQVSDIENVLELNPDIIISIPVDETSTAVAYQKAADAGVKLVFMDNCPSNMTAGKDYVSIVAADRYGCGMICADLMAKELNYEGTVGVIYYDADFFVTTRDCAGFVDRMKLKYPNIEIVTEMGFADATLAGEVADAMLAQYPDIDGIFGSWDVPAEYIASSASAVGRDDLVVNCVGLGTTTASMTAGDGIINTISTQRPYDQGCTEALLACYGLLGKDAPEYVTVPALGVTKEGSENSASLKDAYQLFYQIDTLPDWLQQLM